MEHGYFSNKEAKSIMDERLRRTTDPVALHNAFMELFKECKNINLTGRALQAWKDVDCLLRKR